MLGGAFYSDLSIFSFSDVPASYLHAAASFFEITVNWCGGLELPPFFNTFLTNSANCAIPMNPSKKKAKNPFDTTVVDNTDKLIHKQDKLMPPSSWKDYAANGNGHHTNYAYEHFEADPRGGMPPLPPGAPRGHHPQMPLHHNGSLQRPRPSGGYSRGPQGYSLPRPTNGYGGPPPPPPGYGSYDRRGYHGRPPSHMQPPDYAPDHYFMPSQRKYSGEVVRVFVDYNK